LLFVMAFVLRTLYILFIILTPNALRLNLFLE
jgi:hypothetical protein